jgi:hypothetical protein
MNFRNDRRLFGIRRRDRRFHMHVIGKTGTGKSTLLGVMAYQDIVRGEGLALLDPHGDLVESLIPEIPERRADQVLYFDLGNPQTVLHFNPLDAIPEDKRPLVAAGLLEAFKKIWADSWGVRMEHILRNSLLTLLDQPNATLADILPLLDSKVYREAAVEQVTNEQVQRFWTEEYEKYSWRYRADAIGPIQNKVGAFLADPTLNRVLTNPRSSFNLREVMDEGQILLVNLAKGKIGEDSAALLGAMLVSQIGSAGMSRADVPDEKRRDFYVYLDEFQTFTTLSLANMLSELRKYKVSLMLAHQYLGQVDDDVADAIVGNVGTIVTFRVGPKDATFLAKEFYPVFEPLDLMNLPNHNIIVKLMIDRAVSRPFSATAIEQGRLPL